MTIAASAWSSAPGRPAAAPAINVAGSANGISRPIVPHDEPVVNAMAEPMRNTHNGSHFTEPLVASRLAIWSAAPSALNIPPSVHARTSTTSAGSSDPAPWLAATSAS